MRQLKVKTISGLLVTFFLISSSYALPTDKEQVMQIMADFADLNQKTRLGTYEGHVELIQGTTNLKATKALTKVNEKNKLILAIAKGSNDQQAHYWTLNEAGKPPVHAYADTIRYHPLEHLIELIGNARVEQGKDSFSAAKISYDIQKQQVLSNGDGKRRITIIYHPDKKSL